MNYIRRMNLWADLKLFSNVIYGPNLCLPHKTHRTIIFQLKDTFLQLNKNKRCVNNRDRCGVLSVYLRGSSGIGWQWTARGYRPHSPTGNGLRTRTAHGYNLCSAATRAGSKDEARQGEAKPGGDDAIVVRISAFMADQWQRKKIFELKRQARGRQHPVLRHPYPALPGPVETLDLGSSLQFKTPFPPLPVPPCSFFVLPSSTPPRKNNPAPSISWKQAHTAICAH